MTAGTLLQQWIAAVTVQDCPECAAGKCGNCNGSWDNERDAPAACPCAEAGHPRRTA